MAASQSSTASSVRDRLPTNCFLNLSDDDEETLEQLVHVEDTFFSLGTVVENINDPEYDSDSDSENVQEDDQLHIDIGTVKIEPSDEDIKYMKEIENFRSTGCECSLYHDGM